MDNQRYEEREDEFDVEDEEEAEKRREDKEEGNVLFYPQEVLDQVRAQQDARRERRERARFGTDSTAQLNELDSLDRGAGRSLAETTVAEGPYAFWSGTSLENARNVVEIAQRATPRSKPPTSEGKEGEPADVVMHDAHIVPSSSPVSSFQGAQQSVAHAGLNGAAAQQEEEEVVEEERLVEIVDEDDDETFRLPIVLDDKVHELDSDGEYVEVTLG